MVEAAPQEERLGIQYNRAQRLKTHAAAPAMSGLLIRMCSRILDHNTLDDVGDVFASVGHRLEVLVNRAQLD